MPDRTEETKWAPLDIGNSAWAGHLDVTLGRDQLTWVSQRATNVLFDKLGVKTIGDLLALDFAKVSSTRSVGAKTCAEIQQLRDLVFARDPDSCLSENGTRFAMHNPSNKTAKDYDSLADMILELARPVNERDRIVLELFMALLNVREKHTLQETGDCLNLTRERIRQIKEDLIGKLFLDPPSGPVAEVVSCSRGLFEDRGWKLTERELETGLNASFGWTGTTAFSVRQMLVEYCHLKIVDLPDGRLGWNEDGRFDGPQPTEASLRAEARKRALLDILGEAGPEGRTIDQIVEEAACSHPEAELRDGVVRGMVSNNADLDDQGTRIIGLDRGAKNNGSTRHALNSFFQDRETVSVLEEAARDLRARMESTGIGIVSVWKTWEVFHGKLPPGHDLPKLGFYMMLRDIKAGGLSYPEYPRVAHPEVESPQSAYWWELYKYCALCGRRTATAAEIMNFLIHGIGEDRGVAASALQEMHLEREGNLYVVRCPDSTKQSPMVFLPTIRQYQDFSLASAPGLQLPVETPGSVGYASFPNRAIAPNDLPLTSTLPVQTTPQTPNCVSPQHFPQHEPSDLAISCQNNGGSVSLDEFPIKRSLQYFISFTIEGYEKESSERLISKVQSLLHAWVLKKERDFGSVDSELPRYSEFEQGGKWENNRLRWSCCTTASGRLDHGRMAWGLYYEHAFQESSRESVVLDFVVAATTPHAVAVVVSLYFKGNGQVGLSPPAFVSDLLRFGVRTYNSRCSSERFFDLIQKSVSHARGSKGVSTVAFTELTPFLADGNRSETVVAICKSDLDGLDQARLKETVKKILRTATNLSGKALFFLLDGRFTNCRVFKPKVLFTHGREIFFPGLNWEWLERSLSKADPPPIEDGVPKSCVNLLDLINASASPVPPTPDTPECPSAAEPPLVPPKQLPEQPIRQESAPDSAYAAPPVPFARLAQSTERLRNALSSLVSMLDRMLGGENARP